MDAVTAQFVQCCEQETAVLAALLSLLEEEQSAIVRFDAFRIDDLAKQKQDALLALQQCKQMRVELCGQLGLTEQSQLLGWLSQSEPAVQQGWIGLEHSLARVHAMNDINASMAQERMDFADKALRTLRDEARQIDGYGRHGTFASPSGPSSRRLGSA